MKASEEIQEGEGIEEVVCADYEAERNFIQDKALAESHEFEMSETFDQESVEVTVPSRCDFVMRCIWDIKFFNRDLEKYFKRFIIFREYQNVVQDFDQVSVCTNEISEAESFQASEGGHLSSVSFI